MLNGIKDLINAFRQCGWFWCEPQPCQNSIFPQGCALLEQLQEALGDNATTAVVSLGVLTVIGGSAIAANYCITSTVTEEGKKETQLPSTSVAKSKNTQSGRKPRIDRSTVISGDIPGDVSTEPSLQSVVVLPGETETQQPRTSSVQFKEISGVSEQAKAMIERSRASFQEEQGRENQTLRKSDAEKKEYAKRMSEAGRRSMGMLVNPIKK